MSPENTVKKVKANVSHRELSSDEMLLVLLVSQLPATPFDSKEIRKTRLEVKNAFEVATELDRIGFPACLDPLVYTVLRLRGSIE